MTLQAIKYDANGLVILDQLELPCRVKYMPIKSTEEGWHAIKEMRVRGAPAIAIVAILSLATELNILITDGRLPSSPEEVQKFIAEMLRYLVTSRPTAVNLSDAARKFNHLVAEHVQGKSATGQSIVALFVKEAERMLENDLIDNKKIGANGADWILGNAALSGRQRVNVLTHCNTG
jgi:methylthioribose-1-phosphate isomerase